MRELQFTVPAEQSGKRIDSWLAEQIEGLTRSAAQNLLSEQAVSCNGQPLKKNYKQILWWSTSHAAWLCIQRPATGTARW